MTTPLGSRSDSTADDRVRLPSDLSRIVKGVDVLPWVLSPLMGAEEYDTEDMEKLPPTLQLLPPRKEREKDPVLRMMCIEILLLLSTSRSSRRPLSEHKLRGNAQPSPEDKLCAIEVPMWWYAGCTRWRQMQV